MTVPGPPLTATAYDRATHRRTDDDWLTAAWESARVVAVSPQMKTPTWSGSDDVPHLVYREPASVPGDAARRFLGVADGVAYFAAGIEADDADAWLSAREIGPRADDLEAGLLISAIALEEWHSRHGFCPRCGAPTTEAQAGWTRVCSVDDSEHFPRTDPAVIMLVHDGGDLALLGRGPQWGEGRFSTLAGFVEPGESIEAAVAREVFEEVGVATKDIRYLASQPWPFPASLMLGFVALLDGDSTLTLDENEMAEAGWFTRDEVRQAADWTDERYEPEPERRLRAIPPHFSISRYLIDKWLAGEA